MRQRTVTANAYRDAPCRANCSAYCTAPVADHFYANENKNNSPRNMQVLVFENGSVMIYSGP
jgi:hypothetical protein